MPRGLVQLRTSCPRAGFVVIAAVARVRCVLSASVTVGAPWTASGAPVSVYAVVPARVVTTGASFTAVTEPRLVAVLLPYATLFRSKLTVRVAVLGLSL